MEYVFFLTRKCLQPFCIYEKCPLLHIFSVQLFHVFNFLSDNKMLATLLSIEPEKVYAMPDPTLPDNDFKCMSTLSDLADRELVATIGWAKQVPGECPPFR